MYGVNRTHATSSRVSGLAVAKLSQCTKKPELYDFEIAVARTMEPL